MAKKVKEYEYDYSIGRGHSHIRTIDYNTVDDYESGVVYTIYGIVGAYAQGSETSSHITSFRFVYNGKCYCKNFSKRYTKRGMSMKAKQFAKEVIEKNSLKTDDVSKVKSLIKKRGFLLT